MNKNRNFIFLLTVSFFIYAMFFWIQMMFLGRRLMVLETTGQAVHIMQSSKIFIVKIMRVFISNKKAWYFAIPGVMNEISIPYVILFVLWQYLNDDEIFKLLSATIIVPILTLIGVLISLNQKTLAQGLSVAHAVGLGVLIFSGLMSLVTLRVFLKKRKKLENI